MINSIISIVHASLGKTSSAIIKCSVTSVLYNHIIKTHSPQHYSLQKPFWKIAHRSNML